MVTAHDVAEGVDISNTICGARELSNRRRLKSLNIKWRATKTSYLAESMRSFEIATSYKLQQVSKTVKNLAK